MTRFARAKGSKSSNERIPEPATDWAEMKLQLEQKKEESKQEQVAEEAEKRRTENYGKFLKEIAEDEVKNAKWSDIKVGSDSEAPEEVSSKVSLPEVQVQKAKKRKLKIVVNQENNVSQSKQPKLNQGGNNQKPGKQQQDVPNGVVKDAENSGEKKKIKRGGKKKKPEPKPKKPLSELTEVERQKVEKKKEKRLKQMEKRKLVKAQQKEEKRKQAEAQTSEATDAVKPAVKPSPKKAPKPPKKKMDPAKLSKRKPHQDSFIMNGREVPIAYMDGFPIKKDDYERIQTLRKQMQEKKLPPAEIKVAMKLERRRAEKVFAREKKKVCFKCRLSGHNLSECPELAKDVDTTSGICFKCGSTEHTHFECKVVNTQNYRFAKCFICQEQGHISRQCPDNAKGLYPKGGACNVCGDVTHLKKDCPQYQQGQEFEMSKVRAEILNGGDNPEDSFNERERVVKENKRENKIIKF